jgi:hypothetical protein
MAAKSNLETLQGMWKAVTSLSPSSSGSEIEKVADFFDSNAVAYLNGMSSPPAEGREGIIEATTQLIKVWKMHKLGVTSVVVSPDGKSIVQTMKNDLRILGKDVEGFYECEVVTFSEEGLIERYELYCDPAPIAEIFQEASAGGF